MVGMRTFSWFVSLLIILPIFGKSIHQRNVKDNEQIVGRSIEQILPTGMNASLYNSLVISYWTPERMASAKPMDLLMINSSSNFKTVNDVPLILRNEHTSLPITIPGVLPKSLKAAPSVIGKLFFRIGTGNYLCSGSVIVSENGDTLLTAGHCVFDTDSKSWATDFLFVPGYSSGSAPYGQWVWRSVAAMTGWTQNTNYNYDVAVILVATSDSGEHIQDLTGSLGMTVNRERQVHTDAYGYPVNIHRGEILASCSDEAKPANIPQLPSYIGMKLPCNMTGGSSGGPWVQDDSYQTSVNSFGLVGQDEVMYGPYFGSAVLNLWQQYQSQ